LLLNDIQIACKLIAVAVSRGTLDQRDKPKVEAPTINVQCEEQKPVDALSNDIMISTCEWGGRFAGMVSEELEDLRWPWEFGQGNKLFPLNRKTGRHR
jgi:fructose-1,6-bisphosphatase